MRIGMYTLQSTQYYIYTRTSTNITANAFVSCNWQQYVQTEWGIVRLFKC